jgi:hypothetical protein
VLGFDTLIRAFDEWLDLRGLERFRIPGLDDIDDLPTYAISVKRTMIPKNPTPYERSIEWCDGVCILKVRACARPETHWAHHYLLGAAEYCCPGKENHP